MLSLLAHSKYLLTCLIRQTLPQSKKIFLVLIHASMTQIA